ncbi:MAG TPA: hypothetical protein VN257_07810 [Actinotalea sp.]|nr:hypothetical protein [Actinotalea sp.]
MAQDWNPKTPAPRPAGGRATRLSADQVRDRMVRQGVEVIRARGLTVGLDDVRMEDLIAAAEVPRSSVWRIWPGKWDYLVDVLVAAADVEGANLLRPDLDEDAIGHAVASLEEHAELLADPAGRRTLLLATVRIALEHIYRGYSRSREWRTYVTLIATVNSVGDEAARRRIGARLHAAERVEVIAAVTPLYERACEALGLRLRQPGYTFEHVALAGWALVEGLALRNAILEATGRDGDAEPPLRPTLDDLLNGELVGPDGPGGAPWSTAAVAFLGILDAFLEPDPAFVPGSRPTA